MTYFRYISGFPWQYLASSEGAKGIDRGIYIVTTTIESTCIRDTYIGSTCIVGTCIGCFGIESTYTKGICAKGTSVKGVEPRILARLGVTLTDPRVNYCCL